MNAQPFSLQTFQMLPKTPGRPSPCPWLSRNWWQCQKLEAE